MDLIKELNKEALQKETANVQVGDTVRVHVKVKEGSRERIQVFEGTVIAKKHGGSCKQLFDSTEKERLSPLFFCYKNPPQPL